MQFLYADGTDAHFMDEQSFEQLAIPESSIAGAAEVDQAERVGRPAVHRRRSRPTCSSRRPSSSRSRTPSPACAATPRRAAATSPRRSRPAPRSTSRCSSTSATGSRWTPARARTCRARDRRAKRRGPAADSGRYALAARSPALLPLGARARVRRSSCCSPARATSSGRATSTSRRYPAYEALMARRLRRVLRPAARLQRVRRGRRRARRRCSPARSAASRRWSSASPRCPGLLALAALGVASPGPSGRPGNRAWPLFLLARRRRRARARRRCAYGHPEDLLATGAAPSARCSPRGADRVGWASRR